MAKICILPIINAPLRVTNFKSIGLSSIATNLNVMYDVDPGTNVVSYVPIRVPNIPLSLKDMFQSLLLFGYI